MGALIAAVILSGRALAPLGQIASLATRFQQARLAMQGVNEIVRRPVERESQTHYLTVKDIQGNSVSAQSRFFISLNYLQP